MSVSPFQLLSKLPIADGVRLGVGGAGEGLARQLLDRNASPLGLDIAGLLADLGAVNRQDPALGSALGTALGTQLTPVEMGQLLSGRYGDASLSPLQPPSRDGVIDRAEKPNPADSATAPPLTRAAHLATVAAPADAPAKIQFAPEVQKSFETLRRRSFPGGVSREQGGTIVADSKGRLSLQNIGGDGSTSGSFTPKLTLKDPSRFSVRGVFHTHPYDKSEGSYTGVSLSGGDAAYLINSGQSIIVAQSGAKQFAYVRTAKTPSSVDAAALDKAQNERIATLVGQGYSFPQASRQAAAETAKTYDLAYYEGSGGTLVRK